MDNIDTLQHIFEFIHPFHLRGCYLSCKYIHNYIESIKKWMIKYWCYIDYIKANKLSFKQIVEASLFYTPLLVKHNNHSIISLFHNECRNIFNNYGYSKEAIRIMINVINDNISNVNECGYCEECLRISVVTITMSIILYRYQVWEELFTLSSRKSIFSSTARLLYSIYEYKSNKQITYKQDELIMDTELINSHIFNVNEKCEMIIIAYKLNPCDYNTSLYNCLIGKDDLQDDVSILRNMYSTSNTSEIDELLEKYTRDSFIPYQGNQDIQVYDSYLFRCQNDLDSEEYWYYNNMINLSEHIFVDNHNKDRLCELLLTIDSMLMYIVYRDKGYPIPKQYHLSSSFFISQAPHNPLK